jgi:FkbM family methyltransferase
MTTAAERTKWIVAKAVLSRLPSVLGPTMWARTVVPALDDAAAPTGAVRLERRATVMPDPTDRLQREALLTGRWDSQAARLLAAALPASGTMFDVGANVGLASLSVGALSYGRSVTIHAFEPSVTNLAHLRRNASANKWLDLRINACAVGASAGRARLVLGEESGHHHVAHNGSTLGQAVHVITLDDYAAEHQVARIDALKLDVEGYELSVLQGCERLLEERRIGMILCEVEDDHLRRAGTSAVELVSALQDSGFAPFGLSPVRERARNVIEYRPPRLAGDVAFFPLADVT